MKKLFRPSSARRGAIILGAAGGGTIVGSIGSWTFQRNPFGNLVRSRVKPVDPNTPRQQDVKTIMTQASESWNTMSQANRDGWISYAANTDWISPSGQTVNLSGRQMFIRTAFFLLAYSGSLDPTAPSVTGIPAHPNLTITLDSGTGDVNVTAVDAGGVYSDGIINPLTSRLLRPSRNYWKGPFEQTAFFLLSDALPITIANIGGTITAGDKVFVRYALWEADNNRVSTHVIQEVIAT